jgi:hypothetical protein
MYYYKKEEEDKKEVLASNLAPYQVQESDDGSPRYHVEHL